MSASRYRTRLVAPQEPGRVLLAEDFGSGLDGWTWVREPGAEEYEVTGGELVRDVQNADLFVASGTASVLTRQAPRGDYVVETRGDPADRVRQGVVPRPGRGAEPLRQHRGRPSRRLDDATHRVERLGGREQREAGGDTERYTAYTRRDDQAWVRGGSWTHPLGDARTGLVSMGGPDDHTAHVDEVAAYRLKAPGSYR